MKDNERVCLTIYRGEKQVLITPVIKHISGCSVESKNVSVVKGVSDFQEIGNKLLLAGNSIEIDEVSKETNAEIKERLLWKLYSKCKSGSQFYKKYFRAQCIFDDSGQCKIYSSKKKMGGYGGCIKEINLPKEATAEDIGRAVMEVLDAAEEFYKIKKPLVTKTIELLDGSKLTMVQPKDSHFVDSDDCHAAEIYQCYSYLQSEDSEASAEFFVGIAPEIGCDLEISNVNKCWEKAYGSADYFHMQEVTCGIFKYRAEMKNKEYHKISYFLRMENGLILECGMNVYKPNRRRKLDEKLAGQFEEFALSCRF